MGLDTLFRATHFIANDSNDIYAQVLRVKMNLIERKELISLNSVNFSEHAKFQNDTQTTT